MKIDIQLNELHKAILRLVSYFPYNGIEYDELHKGIELLFDSSFEYRDSLNLEKMVKTSFGLGIGSYRSDNNHERTIKNSLVFLEQADLISSIFIENQYIIYQGNNGYKLTDEGKRLAELIKLDRIIKIRLAEAKRTKVFFACAFGHEDTDLLFNQIRKSNKRIGLTTVRIDEEEGNQTITDNIINEIYDSKCIIADLTYARPSVYFEIGIAQGLGMPIILTCRSDHYRSANDSLKVHFDLEQFKISFWKIEQKKLLWIDSKLKPLNRIKKI